MKGVTFGNFHSYKDLQLILTEKEIGSPEVKTHTINVEGADGELDYTDFFGEPKYKNVQHRFTFTSIRPYPEFMSQFTKIKNAIHGKRQKIILDDDPAFFYWGRCFVSSFTNEKRIGTVMVECNCDPYKLYKDKTTVKVTIDGSEEIPLNNGRKRAVPEVKIETDGSIRIVSDYNIWDLGAGTYTLPELELTEGENMVTLSGTGTVTFTWQEGEL